MYNICEVYGHTECWACSLSLSLSHSLSTVGTHERTSARACGVQQYSTVKMWAHSLTAITTHKKECEGKREACNQKQKTCEQHSRLQCMSFSLFQLSEWDAQHAARRTQQERDLLLDGIFERIPLKFNLASCLLAILRGRFFAACHLAPLPCLLPKDLSSAPFYKYENHFCGQEQWNSKSINIC